MGKRSFRRGGRAGLGPACLQGQGLTHRALGLGEGICGFWDLHGRHWQRHSVLSGPPGFMPRGLPQGNFQPSLTLLKAWPG